MKLKAPRKKTEKEKDNKDLSSDIKSVKWTSQ